MTASASLLLALLFKCCCPCAFSLIAAAVQAPSIVENYDLDLTTPAVRARIRQEFEKHRNVQDVNVIDRLIFKSRTEYEETINMWKQKTHVMRYFEDDVKLLQSVKPVSFLDKFLAGRED